MMRRILALFLGFLLLFPFAVAEDAVITDADPETNISAVPEDDELGYMFPEGFVRMYNASFKTSADLIRNSVADEETDRLIEKYTLTQSRADGQFLYYGSEDWLIEAVFVFRNEEEVSPDAPAFMWNLVIMDEAEENAWYLAMYALNLMVGYTYRDTIGYDKVLQWFQTVTPGTILELPDGYALTAIRGEDCIIFDLYPVSEENP